MYKTASKFKTNKSLDPLHLVQSNREKSITNYKKQYKKTNKNVKHKVILNRCLYEGVAEKDMGWGTQPLSKFIRRGING